MNPILILLLPVFYIGITIGIILLSLLIFFLLKFKKTKKKIYPILAAVILILALYSSVDISFAKNGKVINALSDNPIANIDVIRVFEIRRNVLNPGGESSKPEWYQRVKTDNNGIYKLPVSIHFKIPFLNASSDVIIAAPICENDWCGRWTYERSTIVFDNSEFENEYAYTGESKLIGDDIYLIPKLDQIEKCDTLVKSQLSSDCKYANALRAAIATANPDLCIYGPYPDSCVFVVATTLKNPSICEKIKDSDMQKNCIQKIPTGQK